MGEGDAVPLDSWLAESEAGATRSGDVRAETTEAKDRVLEPRSITTILNLAFQ